MWSFVGKMFVSLWIGKLAANGVFFFSMKSVAKSSAVRVDEGG